VDGARRCRHHAYVVLPDGTHEILMALAEDAMIGRLIRWIAEDLSWGGVVFAAFVFVTTLIVSLLIAGYFLVQISPTYFQDSHSREFWVDRHRLLRLPARISKNILGALLVVLGILLALPGVPGQGLITVLVGLVLLDLPGKRRLERRIVSRPRVLRAINGLRKRFDRAPLVLDSWRGRS
jgi:hypothetical protein